VTARIVTAAAPALLVALLAFRNGGYFPSQWGLELLAFGLVAVSVLIVALRMELARRDLMFVAGLVGLTGWTLVSVAWSSGPDAPVLSAERDLVYVASAAALVLALSRALVPWLLGGVAAGLVAVCVYALATRLFPGDVGDAGATVSGARLDQPIGYANALGALAALGILLCLGLAEERPRLLGAVSGGALVPLAVTLYFTLSRGSLVALAAGLLVFASTARQRLATIAVLAPAPAAGIVLAWRSPLTEGGTLAHVQSAGHRLALELLLLTLVAIGAGRVVASLAPTIAPVALVGAVAVAGAAVVAAVVVWSGPGSLAHRVGERIRADPPVTETRRNQRLFSVTTSWRSDYWRVAWKMVERKPLTGEGGGSFERWWLQERPVASDARNAHNLYLETLAELGPIGLVLLLVALGAPLAAGFAGVARESTGAAALAAYVAWLLHVAFDWDWQIPGVTLPALACAAALVVLARYPASGLALTPRRRALGIATLVPLLAAALVIHVGNRAADAAEAALSSGSPERAFEHARRAAAWMPWAATPWRLRGEAELAGHRDAAARASLRKALSRDGESWIAWYDLSVVTGGGQQHIALQHARSLNPFAPELARP
jgi:O-Antigen ligase